MERIPDAARARLHAAPGVELAASGPGTSFSLSRRRFGPLRSGFGRLFGLRPHLTVNLDPLGAEAWALFPGRTLGQVRDELARRHPDIPDVAQRLGKLVGTLVSRGFAVLEELP